MGTRESDERMTVERSVTTSMRVDELSAAQINRNVRIEHHGWVHVGVLRKVEFEYNEIFKELDCRVALTTPSGARWFQRVSGDTSIEVQSR